MDIINTFVFPIVRQDFIIPALESLAACTPANYKSIVINQTVPNPAFDTHLRSISDLVIQCRLNYGFAQASNFGARLATTPYVTVCNDDVVFLPEWWEGIVSTFARFPTALVVAPMSPKEPGWGYGKPGYIIHAELEAVQHDHSLIQGFIEKYKGAVIDGIAMWCVTFKREEWVELGLFEERFFPGGGDDYDACSRAYQAGYRCLATSSSWIWHHWGQSKDSGAAGFATAQPPARPNWNKLSTKGFGSEGLWEPDCDVWGHSGIRTDKTIARMPL